ncbi:predicted protein [Chaetomium globosum CBS 148.51]|uniref:Uncharacterized protein n=1 Tax=Chaetomium globosum (strain ATCC 6205 / CBS 148.51 / DSM 1962 / NBRC 6347 / NRRL 1970) TaxID=306901 RepID=Q2HBN7_CHAGB|nr:uncharacterized protein CHGG_02367 [Chaetomium globosum CBS 148.51]EAQ90432.1 predicted protein [Chaetomium globosum CBS 148.51]
MVDAEVQTGDAEVQTGDGDGDGDGARVGVDDGAQAEEDWVTSFENLRAWAEGNGDADDIADWEMVEEWPLGPPPVDEFGFELTNKTLSRRK